MTLDTRFLITSPAKGHEVFLFCRGLLVGGEHAAWREDYEGGSTVQIMNRPNQGLDAWLIVYYDKDGGLLDLERRYGVLDEGDMAVFKKRGHPPAWFVEASFDTAYGARGPDRLEGIFADLPIEAGELGCGGLHAHYVKALGLWCEERNLTYSWQNEFTGEWFTDWRLAAVQLTSEGEKARTWVRDFVLPSLAWLRQDL